MVKTYKYGGIAIAVLLIVIAFFFLSKKVVDKIKTVQTSKNFIKAHEISTGGNESISPDEALIYAKRILKDVSWFGVDWSIYSDLLKLSNWDLLAVNNAYLSVASEYNFIYHNIGELIKGENIDPELDAVKLLYRLNELFPNLNYSHLLIK